LSLFTVATIVPRKPADFASVTYLYYRIIGNALIRVASKTAITAAAYGKAATYGGRKSE
jgi:hypothetical protein